MMEMEKCATPETEGGSEWGQQNSRYEKEGNAHSTVK